MNERTERDTLYGLASIADHLGVSERQAKHRVAQGLIPVFRMGRTVCARRSSIDAALAAREAAAQPKREA